jgi:HlyD family secretion protein
VVAGLAWWLWPEGDATAWRTAAVDEGTVRVAVAATGKLSALSTVEVGSQVSGQVLSVEVDFNDSVQAGQAIARLDPANFQSRLEQVQADLTSALASLDAARANHGEAQAALVNAQSAYVRAESVFQRQLISRADYDTAMAGRDQAQARVASSAAAIKVAQSQVAQRRAAVDNAQLDLDYTVIRSPVDGVVIDRVVDLGQTVAASFQTPTLIKIAQDLSEMRIDTSFAEADIGLIREGQKARFTVDAFPNRSFVGDVQQIRLNPTNQQNVVTYNVRITVANPELVLLPGMTAYVNIGVQQRDDVLLVPNAALRFKPAEAAEKKPANGQPAAGGGMAPGMGAGADGAGAKTGAGKGKKRDGQSGTVYVLDGGELRPVSVQLGITDNRNTEIVGGELKGGERVVIGENGNGGKAPSSVGMRMF